MNEEKKGYTENVVLIEQGGKIIGFIRQRAIYMCGPAETEEIATLIDKDFGVINRTRP